MLVDIQSILQRLREKIVNAGVVQAPHLDRVEPELVLLGRAESRFPTVAGIVAAAVIPQVYCVEVVDFEFALGGLQRGIEDVIINLRSWY